MPWMASAIVFCTSLDVVINSSRGNPLPPGKPACASRARAFSGLNSTPCGVL